MIGIVARPGHALATQCGVGLPIRKSKHGPIWYQLLRDEKTRTRAA